MLNYIQTTVVGHFRSLEEIVQNSLKVKIFFAESSEMFKSAWRRSRQSLIVYGIFFQAENCLNV